MGSRRVRTYAIGLLAGLVMAVGLIPGITGNAATPVFADDFETGTLTRWTETTRFSLQQLVVSRGSWAGRATAAGVPAFASATLATGVSSISLEARVNVLSAGTTATLLRLRAPDGKGIVSIRLNTNGRLSRRNEVVPASTTSSTRMTKGGWHTVRLDAVVDGASSTVDIWLDGVRVQDVSGTTSLGTAPISRVQVGSHTAVTMDVAFDDVRALSDEVPADSVAPSVPQELRTTTVTGERVSLTWDASSDDTAVAGYGVFRDGSLIGTTTGTTTSFSDATVEPTTSYTYAVDAFDAADNRSVRSTPLTVQTPVADVRAPSPPTGVTATGISPLTVEVGWVAASDDVEVTGYTIYRYGQPVGTVSGSETRFIDRTVRPGALYEYSVDAVDASGNRSDRSAPAPGTVPDALHVAAAGDICPASPINCAGTASLVEASGAEAVLALGDNQYDSGTLAEYLGSYDLEWGRFRSITWPAPGNHEWKTPNAQGYRDYFGPSFATNGKTWYSFDLGDWHLISLDSQCGQVGGCAAGTPQYTWLQQDLAADDHACTLAFWHRPRFSSGSEHGSFPGVQPFWNLLHADEAELVLGGHEHSYERFAAQTPLGVASSTGIVQIVAGTGGNCCYAFGTPIANSEMRITGVRGILELALEPGSYAFRFTAVDGSVMDSGSGSCR